MTAPPVPDHAPTGPPAEPPRRRPRPLAIVLAAVSAAAVIGAGLLAVPAPRGLGEAQGDAALAAALAPALDGHHIVAAVLLDGTETRFAGFGTDGSREFEIGSVTKTVTAALLTDAVERGEVTLDTTVADVLGERAAGSAIADVTLLELASHTSGLPRLDAAATASAFVPAMLRHDPYATTPEGLVEAALTADLTERGTVAYSNLGSALLGQLLALRAGVSYEELAAERFVVPLGLGATRVPTTPEELGPDAPTGATEAGQSAGAWTMGGYAPAGAARSTADDVALVVRAAMSQQLPGQLPFEAVAPVAEGTEIGVAWFRTALDDGRSIVWHNGMTGGFASFVGYVEGEERGIVILTDTAKSVDEIAISILEGGVTA